MSRQPRPSGGSGSPSNLPRLDAYESRAGFYIGTFCGCGPYSRESGYYPTFEAATAAFGRGYSR